MDNDHIKNIATKDDYYKNIKPLNIPKEYITLKVKKKWNLWMVTVIEIKKDTIKKGYKEKKASRVNINKILKRYNKRVIVLVPVSVTEYNFNKSIKKEESLEKAKLQKLINKYLRGIITLEFFSQEIFNPWTLEECLKLRLWIWFEFNHQIYLKLRSLEDLSNKIYWRKSRFLKTEYNELKKNHMEKVAQKRLKKKKKTQNRWLQNRVHWYR